MFPVDPDIPRYCLVGVERQFSHGDRHLRIHCCCVLVVAVVPEDGSHRLVSPGSNPVHFHIIETSGFRVHHIRREAVDLPDWPCGIGSKGYPVIMQSGERAIGV